MIKEEVQNVSILDMVDKLAEETSLLKLGGERKNMTFFFMDIVGLKQYQNITKIMMT